MTNKLLFAVGVGFVCSLASSSTISYLKYIRFVLYFYFIYEIFRNTEFTINQFSKLIKYIIGLIVLQGVASAIQGFVIGNRVEGYVGLMSSLGGSTATSFPVMIVGICSLILIFSNKNISKKMILWLCLCIVSSCLVGYSSGKRAIYFMLPVVIFISYILARHYISPYRIGLFRKKVLYGIVISLCVFPIFIAGISSSRGLSYSLSGDESNIEILIEALVYAEKYESAKAGQLSIGRSGTTKNILNQSFSSAGNFFFGAGFGSIKDENITKKRNVGYGIVGFTRDVFSGGIIFAILVALWYMSIIWGSQSIVDGFSQALKWMLLCTFIFIHFTYASDYTVHLKLTILLAISLCYIHSDNYSHIKEYYSKYLS